jgi:hypothetical protein
MRWSRPCQLCLRRRTQLSVGFLDNLLDPHLEIALQNRVGVFEPGPAGRGNVEAVVLGPSTTGNSEEAVEAAA